MTSHKKIGFLSFGAWHPGGGLTHTAGDALRQTVELAVAAEEIGIDGAFVRVHHFARQLSSPFPLLAAIGVRTSRIEIGTGVIDMRYENPLYMAEDAASADLLAGGRLQLGVSRGSPEPAWRGAEAFGYSVDPDQARDKTALFRAAIAGAGVVPADIGGRPGDAMLAVQPQSPGLADRIWWGSGSRETAVWAGEQGLNLMSSTLLLEDTQVPFDQLQAEQIELFHEAWTRCRTHPEASRLGQPQCHPDHLRPRPATLRHRRERRPGRLARRRHQPLRPQLHRRARPDRRRARQRRGRPGRRHDPPHRAEPARRRLQRRDARDDCPRHRTRRRLEPRERPRTRGVTLHPSHHPVAGR